MVVSWLPEKIHHFNVLISLENTIFQLKTLVLLVQCNICTVCGFLYPKHIFLTIE